MVIENIDKDKGYYWLITSYVPDPFCSKYDLNPYNNPYNLPPHFNYGKIEVHRVKKLEVT